MACEIVRQLLRVLHQIDNLRDLVRRADRLQLAKPFLRLLSKEEARERAEGKEDECTVERQKRPFASIFTSNFSLT